MDEEQPVNWFEGSPQGSTRSSGIWSGARVATGVLVQLASVMVLSRLLEPEIFGLMATVQFFLIFLGQFNATTFSHTIVEKEEISAEQASGLFWMNVFFGLVLLAAMVGIGYPLAIFFNEPVLFPVAIALGALFLMNALCALHMALLERQSAYRRLMLISVSGGVFGLVVAVLMAIFGLGIWALVGQTLCATLVWVWLSWRFVRWMPGSPFDKLRAGPHRHIGFKGFLRDGIQSSSANLVSCLGQNIQPVILAKLGSPLQAGYFNRAQVVFQRPLNQLLQPFVSVLFPTFSAHQAEDDDFEGYLHKANYIHAFVLLPILVLFICFSETLVPILLGRQFIAAGPVVKWLAVSFIPLVLVGEQDLANVGHRQRDWSMRLPLIGLPFLILGIIWAAPHGAVDVAIVVAAYQWILVFPKAYLQLKGMGMDLSRYLASAEIRGLQIVGLIALGFFMRQWITSWSVFGNITVMVGFVVVGYVLLGASFAAFKDGREIFKAGVDWWQGRFSK